MSRPFVKAFFLALAVFTSHLIVIAQEASLGGIEGKISDPSGAVVAGANIDLLNVATGVHQKMNSNGAGVYDFRLLPSGDYSLTVTAPGFRALEQKGIRIISGNRATLDVTLQVGAPTQEVTVNSLALTLDTSSSATGITRVNEELSTLPLTSSNARGRMAQSILRTFPGITYSAAGYNEDLLVGYASAMNGSNSSYATYEINGASGATSLGNTSGGNAGVNPEVVSELRVETNPNAEYGSDLGNVLSIVTKSGTNQWHGSAYQYYMSGKWASDDWFANANPNVPNSQKRTLEQENEPGGTIGGPILKDRLFVFASFDSYHYLTSAASTVSTMPTAAMRNGDFSQVLGAQVGTDVLGRPIYTGEIYDPSTNRPDGHGGTIRDPFMYNGQLNVIPLSRLSPQSRVFTDVFPMPNQGGPNAIVNNLFGAALGFGENDKRPTGKIDAHLGKHAISGSFEGVFGFNVLNACTNSWSPSTAPGVPEVSCIFSNRNNWGWRVSDTVSLSPSLLLDGSFSRNWIGSSTGVCCAGETYGKTMGMQGFLSPTVPFVFTQNYGLIGDPSTIDNYGPQGVWTIASNLSWAKSKHSFRFGGQFEREFTVDDSSSNQGGTFNFSQAETGLPGFPQSGWDFASIMLGLADTVSAGVAGSKSFAHGTEWGFYAQDSWRITPKLTLNYGLRWDIGVSGGYCNVFWDTFDPTIPNPGAGGLLGALAFNGPGLGRQCATENIDWREFGPRVGLAYALPHKSVLRLYYGMDYLPNDLGGLTYQAMQTRSGSYTSPDNGLTAAYNWSNPFTNTSPTGSVIIPPAAQASHDPTQANGAGVTWYVPNDDKAPRGENFGASVETQLPYKITFTAAYVGKMVHGLMQSWQYDPIPLKSFPLGALLNDDINSPDPTVQAQISAAGIKLPYAGFVGTVGQALRPYPQYTSIMEPSPSGYSTYNALQLSAQKQYGIGLSFLVNYTASKYIDLGSFQTPELRYTGKSLVTTANQATGGPAGGPSDRPQVFNASYRYELPVGKGKHFANNGNPIVSRAISGWSVSGTHTYFSGQPLLITGNSSYWVIRNKNIPIENPEGCSGYDPFNPAKNHFLNPGAFSDPVGVYTLGNSYVQPTARDCGLKMENLSLVKDTEIKEKLHVELGLDAFNAFNRHNWFVPINNIDSPAYGQIVKTSIQNLNTGAPTNSRTLQIHAKITF